MSQALSTYLAAQNRAVVHAFVDSGWCICAAISRDALESLAAQRQGVVRTLSGQGNDTALVVQRQGHAELWLPARQRGYTAPFLRFVEQHFGFRPGRVPPGWQVDHLFSRGRVQALGAEDDNRLPYGTLVRLLLVQAEVNQSFGGLMEGAMIGSGNPFRAVRRFTYLQLAKALSLTANRFGGGLSGPHQMANFAHVTEGFEAHGVLAGLGMGREQMMQQLLIQAETVQHYRQRGRPALSG